MIQAPKHKSISMIVRLITICLKSLRIPEANQASSYAERQVAQILMSDSIGHPSHHKSCVNIIQKTLDLKNSDRDKIVFMLINYSDKNKYDSYNKKAITEKYIERFTYKYHKDHYYRPKIKSKSIVIQYNILHILAIITLYTVYKLLAAKNKFHLCEQFKHKGGQFSLLLSKDCL